MKEKVIVEFKIIDSDFSVDLEVPLEMTASELVNALNVAYSLDIDTSDIKNCFLKAENPIALLKGNKTLAEFGIRNGTIILFSK